MARAKSKRSNEPTIHDRLLAHMEATDDARRWAKEGLAHAKGGRSAQAHIAYRKADAAMQKLEASERSGRDSFEHHRPK